MSVHNIVERDVSEQQVLQDHLERFVGAFVIEEAKSRFLQLAGTPSGRSKFQQTLFKLADKIDKRYAKDLRRMSTEDIRDYLLGEKGLAGETVVLVFDLGTKGEQDYVKLEDAIESMRDGCDSLISILPGRLAYFASEHPRVVWLLEKP